MGDDAQSIYAFRAATVRNILDFPKHYQNTTIVTLEQNYRSTQPILDATNRVIGLARERYTKNLWSERAEGERPKLVNCEDDTDQAEYVIRRILEHREAGVDLRRQAVLFRASHHSILLEAELARANIPFHKYGGLKFVETAHVKDLMAFLRLAENPRDMVSGSRLLPLLPGIGPGKARQLMDALSGGRRQLRRLGRVAPAGRRGQALAEVRRAGERVDEHRGRLAHATRPRAEVLRAAAGGEIRPRRAAFARFGAVGVDRLALPQPAADALGNDARPAQFDARPGRPDRRWTTIT